MYWKTKKPDLLKKAPPSSSLPICQGKQTVPRRRKVTGWSPAKVLDAQKLPHQHLGIYKFDIISTSKAVKKFIVWRAGSHPFLLSSVVFSYNGTQFFNSAEKKYSTKLQLLYILGVGMRREYCIIMFTVGKNKWKTESSNNNRYWFPPFPPHFRQEYF